MIRVFHLKDAVLLVGGGETVKTLPNPAFMQAEPNPAFMQAEDVISFVKRTRVFLDYILEQAAEMKLNEPPVVCCQEAWCKNHGNIGDSL